MAKATINVDKFVSVFRQSEPGLAELLARIRTAEDAAAAATADAENELVAERAARVQAAGRAEAAETALGTLETEIGRLVDSFE